MSSYKNNGPVDCNVDFDRSSVKGKVAIVTGGSQGIGREYVRALAEAGAHVVVGDLAAPSQDSSANDLKNVTFVKCDVTSWEDQVQLFQAALVTSGERKVDIVIANAGILGQDSLLSFDESQELPSKPGLTVTQVDLIGVMYTVKLAMHFFRRQHQANSSSDTCLVLQGSLAGYLDLAGSVEYNASKFGLRGLLRGLRQTTQQHGTRVHYIAPWLVRTKILTDEMKKNLDSTGAEWAEASDAADAVMRFLCDGSVHGRAFAIVPRTWQPRGYVDIDDDDYKSEKHWLGTVAEKASVSTQE